MEVGKTEFDLGFDTGSPELTRAASVSGSQSGVVPGQLIEGRYKVLRQIAKGGMGTVYLVEQANLSKQYALKLLNPNLTDIAWRRFEKEAKFTSRLDHPALISVHDFGLMNGSVPFMVMDYFDGETLAERLKREGSIDLPSAIEIFIQVCFGLAYAHEEGVIHRDIKPSNIMLSKEKEGTPLVVKILDFGIAKAVSLSEEEAHTLTRTGDIFGTPFYMSPEQCGGGPLDHRSDIYSLGCVLFETLTGTRPHVGDSALAIMMMHQSNDVPTLKEASLGGKFPESIEKVVGKMLARDRDSRYQNLFEVAGDLTRIKKGAPVASNGFQSARRKKRKKFLKAEVVAFLAIALSALFALYIGFSFEPGTSGSQGHHLEDPMQMLESPISRNFYQLFVQSQARVRAAADTSSGRREESEYFSSWTKEDPDTRFFHFTDKESDSLGLIADLGRSTRLLRIKNGKPVAATRDASGDLIIQNFHPLGLEASFLLMDQPKLLRRFRPGEVKSLYIVADIIGNGKILSYITDWTALQKLNLRGSRVFSDSCLKYIDQLRNLKDLGLGDTNITSSGVIRMRRLLQLESLDLTRMSDIRPLLQALTRSKTMKRLVVKKTAIDDDDLAIIGKIQSLRTLDISDGGDFTADGLACLAKLPRLEELYMHGNRSAHHYLSAISQLKHLKVLSIKYDTFKPGEKARLEAALPKGCQIGDGYAAEHLND